jgi:hypothetical protein
MLKKSSRQGLAVAAIGTSSLLLAEPALLGNHRRRTVKALLDCARPPAREVTNKLPYLMERRMT